MISLSSAVQSTETQKQDSAGAIPIEDYTKEGLARAIVERIPAHTWDVVIEAMVDMLVDFMPCNILERLTGEPEGFEKATNILLNYYSQDSHMCTELFQDCLSIIPDHVVLSHLDQLHLESIPPSTDDEFC